MYFQDLSLPVLRVSGIIAGLTVALTDSSVKGNLADPPVLVFVVF